MFQLYKARNFSSLINDTFSFFRQSGRNYFKNYFIINGGLLLILIVLCFLVGKVFFERLFSGLASPGSQDMLEEYFYANAGYFIAAGIITGILIIIITIINYSYPVIYMGLAEKHERPETKQILAVFKAKLGRILLFGVLFFITFLPLGVVIGLFSMLMIAIIIGIPVAIILFAAYSCWIYLSFFEYLNNGGGYFDAMKTGWKMLFKNFWPHMGSTAIIYIMIYVIQGIITFIPYMIGIAMMIISQTAPAGDSARDENFSIVGLLMLVAMILYILLAYILGNVVMVSHGMIYYSCREQNENQSLHSEIELIGTEIE
jgi:MFS family permease